MVGSHKGEVHDSTNSVVYGSCGREAFIEAQVRNLYGPEFAEIKISYKNRILC